MLWFYLVEGRSGYSEDGESKTGVVAVGGKATDVAGYDEELKGCCVVGDLAP